MRRFTLLLVFALVICACPGAACSEDPRDMIRLPAPSPAGGLGVEDALRARRSVRAYAAGDLDLKDVALLLWAAQGQTASWGGRTAPSAGALFPVEVLLVAGEVKGLAPGVYRYRGDLHALTKILAGDHRTDVAEAALGQECLKDAPAVLVVSAVYDRAMKKYGDRGIRYAHIEAGAVCENVYLQAVSLDLGTVLVGAFYDDDIGATLGLEEDETPLALMPVGRPAGE